MSHLLRLLNNFLIQYFDSYYIKPVKLSYICTETGKDTRTGRNNPQRTAYN